MFFVYLLRSKFYKKLYIGSTNDLKRRLKEHNDGRYFSTKRYKPWKLFYYEAFCRENLARMREKRLKYHGNAFRELRKRLGLMTLSIKCGAGFTLVELLIVISIIGILTIGGFAKYKEFNDKQKFTQDVRNVRVAMREAQKRAQAQEMDAVFCKDKTFGGWVFKYGGQSYSIAGRCGGGDFNTKTDNLRIASFQGSNEILFPPGLGSGGEERVTLQNPDGDTETVRVP